MINILIVTHGDFGKELLRSSEMIIGKVDNARSISFHQGDSFETLFNRVEENIDSMSEDGLIVFTDMYGGSPYNAVNRVMKDRDFYHITGINFPLFLDIAISRDSYNLKEIAEKIIKNGKKSIVFVNENFLSD